MQLFFLMSLWSYWTLRTKQELHFRWIFGEKCLYYTCTLSSHVWPFSSCFRNPGMFNILSLKAKIMLVKPITFQSCIFKKIKRLIQRTSIVHLVGDFPLKIIRNFKKYHFLTGIQLKIKNKNLSTSKLLKLICLNSKCKYSTGKGNTLTSITLLLPKEKRQKTSI